jgi:uncharacterized protein related to proFAR isomerase
VRDLKIGIEEKLDIISQLEEKGDCMVDVGCNVRLEYVNVHTICDNFDRNAVSVNTQCGSASALYRLQESL